MRAFLSERHDASDDAESYPNFALREAERILAETEPDWRERPEDDELVAGHLALNMVRFSGPAYRDFVADLTAFVED